MSNLQAGRKLKAWRKRQGLSQADASAKARVSQAAWSEYESGKSMPRVDVALRLEKLTDGAV